ncbi:hypothetical protein BpHYR1_002588 [Brachionus plicatilis]|uniref:Uncharacterized protein n=1 Tax=Brachionus plicatilis TaxID=10195 RepID=A0A3M7P4E2_BRAPC|nr:hypothetical protein BpHYR1_002588 [Brachionus plicatilis]
MKKTLTDKEGNALFCEPCFINQFAPRCNKCSEPIPPYLSGTVYEEKNYHKECFSCARFIFSNVTQCCFRYLKNINDFPSFLIENHEQFKNCLNLSLEKIIIPGIAFGSKREKSNSEEFLGSFPAEACNINLGNKKGARLLKKLSKKLIS